MEPPTHPPSQKKKIVVLLADDKWVSNYHPAYNCKKHSGVNKFRAYVGLSKLHVIKLLSVVRF
jgi:hypothetical protein